MIFVTLGTNDKNFDRLLKEIDKQIEEKKIKEKVIVQSGFTKYESKNMKIVDLMPMEEFLENIKKCDVLITHGGVGTILDAIKNNKKVIAFPRLSKYKEHVNDHQIEIINEFYEAGYILTGQIEDLYKILEQAKTFTPKMYKSNNYKFNKNLIDYIEKI